MNENYKEESSTYHLSEIQAPHNIHFTIYSHLSFQGLGRGPTPE